MPSYEYYCAENGKTIEVWHRMSQKISSWGELCQLAALDVGETPAESPVTRLISGGNIITNSSKSRAPAEPQTSSSGCCVPSSCGCS